MKKLAFLVCMTLSTIMCQMAWAMVGDWATFTNKNHVYDLAIFDEEIWGATTGGVVRFDPSDSTLISYTNVDGLGGIDVRTMAVDSLEGSLWFGLDEGVLIRFKPRTSSWGEQFVFKDDEGNRVAIRDLDHSGGDTIWVATEKGMSLFIPSRMEIKESYRPSFWFGSSTTDLAGNAVRQVGKRIWVGTDEGVAFASASAPNLLDPDSWTSFIIGSDVFVNAIGVQDTVVYVGTSRGVYRFNGIWWDGLGPSERIVNCLAHQGSALLAGTDDGLWRYDGSSWTRLDDGGILNKIPLTSVAVSPQNQIWLGTGGEGLASLVDDTWRNYRIDGPISNKFTDLALDMGGNLWVASNGYGVSVFDGRRWTNYPQTGVLTFLETVAVDGFNNKWFGTWGGGVLKMDSLGHTSIYREDICLEDSDPPKDVVVANEITVDSENNLWICNFGVGVILLESAGARCVKFEMEGFVENLPWFTAVDHHGRKWFGLYGAGDHEAGLCRLDHGDDPFDPTDDLWVSFRKSDGMPDATVNSIAVGQDSAVWIGTGNGLVRYDEFTSQLTKEFYEIGYPNVTSIEIDAFNVKWIGTWGEGLLMYEDGYLSANVTRFQQSNSGLVDDNINIVLVDPATGHIWIGTDAGLSRYESGHSQQPDLSQVRVYPNPFLIGRGQTKVHFDRLTKDALVSIHTVAGELVREIPTSGFARWDGRNSSGILVASGVYVFVVRDANGNAATGKIAVIR